MNDVVNVARLSIFLHVHVVEYGILVNDKRRIAVDVIYIHMYVQAHVYRSLNSTYSLSAERVCGGNEYSTSRTEVTPTYALSVKAQVERTSSSSVLPRTILSSSPLALSLRDQTHRSPSLIYPCVSSQPRVQKPTCPSPQLSIRGTRCASPAANPLNASSRHIAR